MDFPMRCTPSGNYRLPKPFEYWLGNLALSLAKCTPNVFRRRFLRRTASYQVSSENELGSQQGLSINNLSYIPGQRVLEWVLQRFVQPDLQLEVFLNFEAMDTDPRIAEAFRMFRQSTSEDSSMLTRAIKLSYSLLHQLGWQHGTSDP